MQVIKRVDVKKRGERRKTFAEVQAGGRRAWVDYDCAPDHTRSLINAVKPQVGGITAPMFIGDIFDEVVVLHETRRSAVVWSQVCNRFFIAHKL